MRKQLKLIGTLVAVCLAAYLGIYAAATLVIQKEFINIEKNSVEQNVARSVDAFNDRINQLGNKSTDWSSWDDTYSFISNKNKEYIESNLVTESLKNIGINYMLFFDTKGKLVYLESIDPATDTPQNTKKLLEPFAPEKHLLSDNSNSIHSGVVDVPRNPLLFYSRPILTSNGEGPYRGTLVFAHYLTDDDAVQISKLTHLTTKYYHVRDKNLPSEIKATLPSLSATHGTLYTVDGQQAEGLELINDAFGKPLIVAKTLQHRDIYIQAKRTIFYFLLIVGLIALISVAVISYIVRQLGVKDEIIHLKDEFFSIASHEIRTPLTAIRGNADLLNQIYSSKNDAAFKEVVSDIANSGERLIRLVTNYLDAARLEQGKITVSPVNFNVKSVTQEVVDEMQGIAKDKGVAVINGIIDESLYVNADKDHFKQVVYNIVGNSLKFTEKGSVTITAKQSAMQVIVYVTDTGRGVPESGKAALFKKFEQVQKNDASKGSGLGLYISKLLVQKMGGTIRLESSEEGKGTTISLTIPSGTADTPAENI